MASKERNSEFEELFKNLYGHLSAGFLRATVLVNPQSPQYGRIVQAVRTVNDLQSYFRLDIEFYKDRDLLECSRLPLNATEFRAQVQKHYGNRILIAMVDKDFNAITIKEFPGCTLISCDDWKDYSDAPAARIYLVYQLISALITFAGCLTENENSRMVHRSEETQRGERLGGLQGCLFDYWVGGKLLYLNMVSARLCQQCRAALLAQGTPLKAIIATEVVVDWVRSVVLGREVPIPRKIFIGHGRKHDWRALRVILRNWDLEVEEFNEEPVAGVSITERLRSMLAQSRFAFLVMTGEDKTNNNQLHARMNVIHEIGLFQGRLGNDSAIVLREKAAATFSNLDGINRLDYEPGKIAQLKPEIYRLLVDRGILSAEIKER